MKALRFFVITAFVTSLATAALAQDEYGEAETTDDPPAYEAPAAQASVSSDLDMGGTTGSYPAFSIGSRLEILPGNLINPVFVEASLDLMSRLSIYALVGFYVDSTRSEFDLAGSNVDATDRYGIFLLGAGARFNIMEPEVKHAHLYASADFIAGFSGATLQVDGDNDADAEDATKELNDRFLFGGALGIEYLFVPEFSMATEVGARVIVNRLDDAIPDKQRDTIFATSFALRFTYHF